MTSKGLSYDRAIVTNTHTSVYNLMPICWGTKKVDFFCLVFFIPQMENVFFCDLFSPRRKDRKSCLRFSQESKICGSVNDGKGAPIKCAVYIKRKPVLTWTCKILKIYILLYTYRVQDGRESDAPYLLTATTLHESQIIYNSVRSLKQEVIKKHTEVNFNHWIA